MPDKERLRPKIRQILDRQGGAARRHFQPGDERIEQNDPSLHRRRERGVGDPGEDDLVVPDAAGPGIDIFFAEDLLPGSNGGATDVVLAVADVIPRSGGSCYSEESATRLRTNSHVFLVCEY